MRAWIDIMEAAEDEDWEEPVPTVEEHILRKGTTLIHGTNGGFDERHGLQSPVWVTNSLKTATYFSKWREDEGKPRLTWWNVQFDTRLAILTKEYLDYLEEYRDIDTSDGPDDVLQNLKQQGFDGWIIPDNYGTGEADICLLDADVLAYVKTTKSVSEALTEAVALNKFWITAAGERVNIARDGHHADEVDEDWGNVFDLGWVRCSKSGHEFNLQFDPKAITRRAIATLLKTIASPLDYVHVDHPRGHDNTYSRQGFVAKMREIAEEQNSANVIDRSEPVA